ncbi:hypothetical protein B0H11DRAFT_2199795 [Mycena galericulata]|nr:hypothetical protein B0H11DRAFT_2199795 [Mycena galericulata]
MKRNKLIGSLPGNTLTREIGAIPDWEVIGASEPTFGHYRTNLLRRERQNPLDWRCGARLRWRMLDGEIADELVQILRSLPLQIGALELSFRRIAQLWICWHILQAYDLRMKKSHVLVPSSPRRAQGPGRAVVEELMVQGTIRWPETPPNVSPKDQALIGKAVEEKRWILEMDERFLDELAVTSAPYGAFECSWSGPDRRCPMTRGHHAPREPGKGIRGPCVMRQQWGFTFKRNDNIQLKHGWDDLEIPREDVEEGEWAMISIDGSMRW